jgi:hypothetical protein
MEIRLAYLLVVIPSRADGEELHIVRWRLLGRRDPSPSARLRMTAWRVRGV